MEWIVTSSVLILIVALLRLVLKGKISLRLQYALWALVLVRLLCPVNLISSPTSVLNVAKEAVSQPEIRNVIENVQEPIRFESKDYEVNPETGESFPVTSTTYIAPSNEINNPYSTQDILMRLWIMGVVLMLGFMLTCNLHFRMKLRRDRTPVNTARTSLPVYVSGSLETPCMVGFLNPTIYLTPESMENETSLRHILEHELTHYYHCDYITAPLRCIALALHWYNPLVWWAAKASRLDGELACDEGTIARLGESERTGYGKTLIQMTCNHRHLTDVMLTATTMSGSKYSIKERITRIAKKPHMAAATLAVVLLTALIAVGCTFTGASNGMSNSLKEEILEHGEEYLQEVNFSLRCEEGKEPYGLLFLPEYMPKEGLSLEVKSVQEDGTEEVLYTQDTVQLGEKYIFTDLDQYGKLKLTAYYMVDGKPIGMRNSYVNLEEWVEHQATVEMADSVRHLMSDYASEYFTKILDRHNNQLFPDDGESYTGVVYQEPNRIVTPMAAEQNLYLYKYEGRFIREDGERISETLYILMHWGQDYWQRVCRVDQETVDSYNTPEMVEKYGSYYDAAAIELYLKHRDDAVELEDTTLILVEFSEESEAVEYLKRPVENFVVYTIQQDYPDQSLTVTVKDLRLLEPEEEDPSFRICYLAFYPKTANGGSGMDYAMYLVVAEDEMGIPFFLKAFEAEEFTGEEEASTIIRQMMEVQGSDN